jgi:GMP reductase
MSIKTAFPKEYDFADVLILPKPTSVESRKEVNLEREFIFCKHKDNVIYWEGIPIIAANMDTTGTYEVYCVLSKYKMITAFHKFYTLADYKRFSETAVGLNPDYFMVSTGISNENLNQLHEIMEYTKCKWICIDVANGYMDSLVTFCKKVRLAYPDKIIMAGNVVCSEMAARLVNLGYVDIVKVGIGSGSACLTRRQTGVGRKQLSAILDCAKIHSNKNTYIVSDGGIREPADAAKAFAAGADFVMIGGFFAGHTENPGEVVEEKGQLYKQFYGMSSKHAMDKHYGGMEKYRSSEGAVVNIPYKGSLEDTVLNLLGGLRSTCSYVGAYSIAELPYLAEFRA